MLKKISMFAVAVLVTLAVAVAPAYDVFAAGTCENPQTTTDCKSCTSATKSAQCASKLSDPDGGNGDDLMTTIRKIITAVFLVIGIVAVVFIIVGGISYATSQGDPSKTAKAKNTILYSIIGLIVSLLAFAIVNFVLEQLG